MAINRTSTYSWSQGLPQIRKAARKIAYAQDTLRTVSSVLLAAVTRNRRVSVDTGKRITFVQFGDYGEAYARLTGGGPENYYAQKYSVAFVGSLMTRRDVARVTVISLAGDSSPVDLHNGVHSLGIRLYAKDGQPRHKELIKCVAQTRPSHLIVFSPCIPLIAWGIRSGCHVLPMFADSFRQKGIGAMVHYRMLATLLNSPSIETVSNHSVAATLELKRIGVAPSKLVAWDWPAVISPNDFTPKSAPALDHPFRLVYVGAVIETKGVGDAIRAVSLLRRRGREVTLTVIGGGEIETFKAMASAEGVKDNILFAGTKTHDEVVEAMREHDAVIVPSRWAYPEGLPMTLYEALCTHTPLVTSDHPAFAIKIRDRYNALVFRECQPESCAERIEELANCPTLYSQLSANATHAANDYLCPLKYDQLISEFLSR
jgi:glycosyltransferase involved in cell wall biosynthesis